MSYEIWKLGSKGLALLLWVGVFAALYQGQLLLGVSYNWAKAFQVFDAVLAAAIAGTLVFFVIEPWLFPNRPDGPLSKSMIGIIVVGGIAAFALAIFVSLQMHEPERTEPVPSLIRQLNGNAQR